MFCTDCGTQVRDSAKFCPACGKPMAVGGPIVPSGKAARDVPPPPTSVPPTAHVPISPPSRRGVTPLVVACAIVIPLVVAGAFFFFRFWNISGRTGVETLAPRTFEGHVGSIDSVAISADSSRILSSSGYKDGSVRLWDVHSGVEVRRFTGHSSNTGRLISAFSSTSGTVVSAGGVEDLSVRVWNIDSGSQVRQFNSDVNTGIFQALAPDGQRAIAVQLGGSHGGGGFSVWDLQTHLRHFAGRKF